MKTYKELDKLIDILISGIGPDGECDNELTHQEEDNIFREFIVSIHMCQLTIGEIEAIAKRLIFEIPDYAKWYA